MADSLDWMFELKSDLSGADEMLGALGRLDKTLKALDPKMLLIEKGSLRAGEAHKKHGHDAEALGGAFKHLIDAGMDPFLHKAKEIAEFEFLREGVQKMLEAPGELMEGIKDLGEEMIMTGAKAERMHAAFSNSLGPQVGKDVLEWIDKLAPKTEFTVARLKDATLDLARVGFKGHGLQQGVEAAGDLAGLNKSGEAGFADALHDLEMLQRTGRITDRTLSGLGVGQKDFFAALSERTGLGIDTLKKQIEKGTLDTSQALLTFYDMVTKKTGKPLGQVMIDMSGLMGAKLAHLGEVPERLMEKASDSAGWQHLTDSFGKLGEQFGPDGVLGKQLGEGVIGLFDRLGPVLDRLPEQIDKLAHAFDGFGKVVDVAWHQGERMVDVLEKMSHFAGALVGVPKPNEPDKSIVGRNITPGGTVDRILHAPDRMSAWIGRKLFDVGGDAAGGMAKGIIGGKDIVGRAAGDLGHTAKDSTKSALDSNSPSKVFEQIGIDTALGFASGVRKSRGLVDEAHSLVYDRVPTPSPPAWNSGGRSQPTQVHVGGVTVTVEVKGSGDAAGDAEIIGQRLRSILPGALVSAFEQAEMEIGTGGDD